ncbi:MAG: hypothetical protein KF843_03055 [Flavobacteriales bacterium]|nr:hypothetical protein [Flavobacteriales bacterium]
MCLKELGAELPMMLGTRPLVFAWILYDGVRLFRLALHRNHLPLRVPMTPEMKALLEQDRRQRGERRPKRLHLGPFIREPYHFFSAKLPNGGLHLPHGNLCGHLGVELYVDSPQPLYPYPVLLHFKGSEPRHHPFGNHLRWVAHPNWTLAEQWARLVRWRDESPCGCCLRERFSFEAYTEQPQGPLWSG